MVDIIVLEQIEAVLKTIIEYYHDTLGVSWGWAIVMLTVTVRIAILPLTIKQFRSMAAMQRIQPKVKALQNRYKGKTDRDSKQQMQKELMELYREHNVNPFASCLPLVFQMPVFIGLYQTLSNFKPPDDRSFLGIDDIFVKLNQIGGATEIIMVVLYCLSMLGSTLLFSFVQDRQQKILFASMSVIFIPFILQVPAGVGLYWISTNIWTILQQGIVKQTMGHHFPAVQKAEKDKEGKQPRTSRNPPKPSVGDDEKASKRPSGNGGPQKPPPRRRKKRR
jgi:YidC/Oxa1 family membrane protein insertase